MTDEMFFPGKNTLGKVGVESTYDPVILADNCVYSSDSKETGLNNNICIIGGSGAGKTVSNVESRMLHTFHDSLVVTLTKRRPVQQYTRIFRKRGYRVLDMNLAKVQESKVIYDPLQYIDSYMDIQFLSESVVYGVKQQTESSNRNGIDDYWNQLAVNLLNALIGCVLYMDEKPQMLSVAELFSRLTFSEGNGGIISTPLDSIFEKLEEREGLNDFTVRSWRSWHDLPMRTAACGYSTLAARFNLVFSEPVCERLQTAKKIDFRKFVKEKTVIFLTTDPVNPTTNIYANLFYGQLFKTLFELGGEREDGELERAVQIIADDFATGSRILNFTDYISVMREHNISVMLLLQSESQLEDIYGPNGATTILNNCDSYLYMGGNDLTTAKHISERADKPLSDILYMPVGNVLLFRRGSKPIETIRYRTYEDPLYVGTVRGGRPEIF